LQHSDSFDSSSSPTPDPQPAPDTSTVIDPLSIPGAEPLTNAYFDAQSDRISHYLTDSDPFPYHESHDPTPFPLPKSGTIKY
jgi:hypothetical protein